VGSKQQQVNARVEIDGPIDRPLVDNPIKRRVKNAMRDPFEVHNYLQRANRRLQALVGILVVAFLVVTLYSLWLFQRPPLVIVKDRISGEPPQVLTDVPDSPITVADARVFFINMLRLRYGWDSLTVARDLDEFDANCYTPQRIANNKQFRAQVPIDPKRPKETRSLIETYQADAVRNTVVMPERIERIGCKTDTDNPRVWRCKLRSRIVTESLLVDGGKAIRTVPTLFSATLVSAGMHTMEIPYGLRVAEMSAIDLTEDDT
jgi:hypothetical protein